MSADRSYLPLNDDLLPQPDAADLAAGIVSPLDIPVGKPIPYLRMKRRQYRVQRVKHVAYQSLIRRHGRAPWVPKEERQLRKLKRVRSSLSSDLPISEDATLFKRARKLQHLDEELLVSTNQTGVCSCAACQHLRNWGGRLQQYWCLNRHCRMRFDSFEDMFEHQLDVHGAIDPRSSRVVDDLFHQQRGTLAYPPSTVYAGQQILVPSRPPVRWKSMEELDQEAKTLRKRLVANNRNNCALPWKLFNWAYKLVKKHGEQEMERQYQVAIEHFNSAYKYPASSRDIHDGCPSVERGRNWLTSTEREDLSLFHPFSLNDKEPVEPEFVLVDTKRDQEMLIELSDDSDDEDAPSGGQTPIREEVDVKVDNDDVEMSDSYEFFEGEQVSEENPVKSEAEDDTSDRNVEEVKAKAQADDVASDDSDDEMEVKSEAEDDASDSSVDEVEDKVEAEDVVSDDSDEEMEVKAEAEDDASDTSIDEVEEKAQADDVASDDSDDEREVKAESEDDASDSSVEEVVQVVDGSSDESDEEMEVKAEVEDDASDTSVEETQVNSDADDESDDDVVVKSEVEENHSEASNSSESDADRTATDSDSESEEEPATQVHATDADSTASDSEASSDEDEQDSEIFNQLE